MVCVQKEKDFLSTNRRQLLSKMVADTRVGSDRSLGSSAPSQCPAGPGPHMPQSAWTADMTNEATALLMGNNTARLRSHPFFRAQRG